LQFRTFLWFYVLLETFFDFRLSWWW
jgi:hypothetical protein